jgi:regulator of protease activity HflC (stomatin/prohibitin superfamily)
MSVAGVVGVILLIWLIFASTVSVSTGEIAVMTRFGRVTGQELGEGFHIKNPLDRANKYDVKVLKADAKAEAASKDLQDIHATLVLNYSLEPGKVSDIHQKIGVTYAAKLIDPAIQEVFKAATAKFDATELITDRVSVKGAATDLLRARLAPHGILVTSEGLSITNFSFSPEFTQAIEAKQVAQQHAQRAKFNLEAATIDAQAQRVQGAALTALFLQKQFLEKWDGHLPNVMAGGGGLDFLLDLQQQAVR